MLVKALTTGNVQRLYIWFWSSLLNRVKCWRVLIFGCGITENQGLIVLVLNVCKEEHHMESVSFCYLVMVAIRNEHFFISCPVQLAKLTVLADVCLTNQLHCSWVVTAFFCFISLFWTWKSFWSWLQYISEWSRWCLWLRWFKCHEKIWFLYPPWSKQDSTSATAIWISWCSKSKL